MSCCSRCHRLLYPHTRSARRTDMCSDCLWEIEREDTRDDGSTKP